MIVKEIGYIIIAAGIFGIVMRLFKQPTVLAYVLGGIFVGPLALGWVDHQQAISDLSELAIVVMLFVIGIEMDLSRLTKVGLVAMLGGSIQVGATFLVGFIFSLLVGTSTIAASYFGFALAFSSTMLVVKVLGEKYDLDTLYGRIVIGILIIQDIFAIFALSILSSANQGFSLTMILSTSTLTAGLILIVVFVCGRYVLPRVFNFAAKEREILFLVTMATLFVVAFYAENQKLSMGIGSFLAGLAIAKLSYKYEVIGDLKALKSFFTILFFAALGLQIAPIIEDGNTNPIIVEFLQVIWGYAGTIVLFLLLAIIVKPLMVTVIVRMFGYQKSTSVDCGLCMGQLSEFSLVLLAQGILAKHVNQDFLTPIIIVTVISMVISTYLMEYNLAISRYLSKYFGWLDLLAFAKPKFDFPAEAKNNFSVLLVGRDQLGRIIENALRRLKVKYVVVDSNPDTVARMQREGIPFIFGDVNNHEVLSQLDFTQIHTVFSTSPDMRDNALLIDYAKKINPDLNFIGIVNSRTKASALYAAGAHYVLVVYILAGIQLLQNKSLKNGISLRAIIEDRNEIRKKGEIHKQSLFKDPVEGEDLPEDDILIGDSVNEDSHSEDK